MAFLLKLFVCLFFFCSFVCSFVFLDKVGKWINRSFSKNRGKIKHRSKNSVSCVVSLYLTFLSFHQAIRPVMLHLEEKNKMIVFAHEVLETQVKHCTHVRKQMKEKIFCLQFVVVQLTIYEWEITGLELNFIIKAVLSFFYVKSRRGSCPFKKIQIDTSKLATAEYVTLLVLDLCNLARPQQTKEKNLFHMSKRYLRHWTFCKWGHWEEQCQK